MIEHYVVFEPHEGRGPDLSAALAAFERGMQGTPGLLEFTWGENVNPSGLKQGYTHGCLARLESEQALKEDYWNRPAHQHLLGQLDELCASRFALDYTVDGPSL
jgi:hypothetical protein